MLLLGAALRRKGKDEGVEEQDMEVTVQAHNGRLPAFSAVLQTGQCSQVQASSTAPAQTKPLQGPS